MTALDIIKLALKMAGVLGQGQTPAAEDANDALIVLNMMLAQWQQKRWLLPDLVDVPVPITGAATYTIGPGGAVDMARPTTIESAYLRYVNQAPAYRSDAPLTVLRSYEDWASIGAKSVPGPPFAVFLDTSFPLATLRVWPVPSGAFQGPYEIHLLLRSVLSVPAALKSPFLLPAEYQEAVFYNLAGRLRAQYALSPDPTVTALARAALNTIRNANAQVPLLRMPDAVVGGGRYNVITDR